MGTLFRPLIRARTWKETLHLLIDLPLGIALVHDHRDRHRPRGRSHPADVHRRGRALAHAPVRAGGVGHRAGSSKGLARCRHREPVMAIGDITGWWPRIKAVLGDAAVWKGVAYCVLALPVGIITFTVAVTFWSIALGGVTAPIWATIEAMVGANDPHGWAYVGITAASFVAGLDLPGRDASGGPRARRHGSRPHPWAARRRPQRGAATPRDAARGQQDARRSTSRRRERTRIERDLHDGVQPRLVVAAMDLGLAREKASGSDPEVVALIERAQDETKQAIAELRELVRGIHPAVLTDRGLDAALSSLAARCPVPVTVQVNLDERPPTPVESAAYFIVAESLTNIAKHSDAKHARVNVNRDDRTLRVEITDDGHGGARTEPGGGLSGLADRVTPLEGTFRVASPVGGPTTILAELPCGS